MNSGWKSAVLAIVSMALAGCAGGGGEGAPTSPEPTLHGPVLPAIADPPIVPFPATGDFHVMDGECGCILRVDAQGAVTLEVSALDIQAVTGWAGVSFDDCGLAFDRAGAMYFSEADSDSILRRDPSGELTQLVSREAILAVTGDDTADPEGLTFGEDGMLYVLEDDESVILRVDPDSGAVSILVTDDEMAEQTGITDIDLGSHIVGGRGRTVYLVTRGDPAAILAVEPGPRTRVVTDSPELGEAEGFLTRDADGNLVLMNWKQGLVQRITPDGTLTPLLSPERLAQIFGDEVSLAGGAAFDAAGNFFLTEDDTESIARLDAALQGGIWIDEPTVRAVTGSDPDYRSGVAFSPR